MTEKTQVILILVCAAVCAMSVGAMAAAWTMENYPHAARTAHIMVIGGIATLFAMGAGVALTLKTPGGSK